MIITAGYLSIFAGTLVLSGTLDSVDNAVSDTIYQWINYNRNESIIKLVMIDDYTVEKLGKYESWSRSKTAEFIEALNGVPKDAPNVIGLDLLYYGERDSRGDTMLEEVCKKYDNICIGTPAIVQEKDHITHGHETAAGTVEAMDDVLEITDHITVSDVLLPYQALLPYTITGVTNIAKYSIDGYVRNAIANITVNGEEMDSFPVAIYKMYRDSIGESYSLPKLDVDHSFGFNYSKRVQIMLFIRFMMFLLVKFLLLHFAIVLYW